MTVGFVSSYLNEEVGRASELLCSVINDVSTCRVSCKHLAMTTLLPPVTRCQDERCRRRTLVSKWASCATEHWLMSAADDE